MPTYTSPRGTPFVGFYVDDQGWIRESRTGRVISPVGGSGGPRQDSGGVGVSVSPYSQGRVPDGLNLPEGPTLPGGITINPIPSRNLPVNPALPPNVAPSQDVVGNLQPETDGNDFTGSIKDFLTNPKNLLGLGGLLTSLIGGLRGGGSGSGAAQAERLNQITEQRMRRADPLHQAVTQLAWGRLPVSARQGISPPSYEPLR